MKSYFDKLNLRPQERRLVVIVGLIFFVVINIWFIFPRFGEWSQVQGRMDLQRGNLDKYQTEIAKRPQYEAKLAELQGGGSEFLTNDLQLLRIVQNQYNQAKLQVSQTSVRPAAQTGNKKEFYQELAMNLSYTSGGNELIDFLIGLAAQNYMIRVREMNVRPDPSQTRLVGNMVLIANLQTNVSAGPKPSASARTNSPAASTNRAPATAAPSKTSTNLPSKAGTQTKTETRVTPPTLAAQTRSNNPSRPPTTRPSAPPSKAAALTNRTDI